MVKEGVDILFGQPIKTWQVLYKSNLENQIYWAGRVGNDDEQSYRFLKYLQVFAEDVSEILDESSTASFEGWCNNQITRWVESYNFRAVNDKISDTEIVFYRASLETIVYATGIIFASDFPNLGQIYNDLETVVSRLKVLYDFMSMNTLYSTDIFKQYLEDLGFLR